MIDLDRLAIHESLAILSFSRYSGENLLYRHVIAIDKTLASWVELGISGGIADIEILCPTHFRDIGSVILD